MRRRFFLFGRQAAELFEQGVEFARFAEVLGFDEFKGLLVGSGSKGGNAAFGDLGGVGVHGRLVIIAQGCLKGL